MSTEYINLQQLADITGRHVSYLSRLVRDGILPKGRKVWRNREIEKQKALEILNMIPTRNRASVPQETAKKITLDDLF